MKVNVEEAGVPFAHILNFQFEFSGDGELSVFQRDGDRLYIAGFQMKFGISDRKTEGDSVDQQFFSCECLSGEAEGIAEIGNRMGIRALQMEVPVGGIASVNGDFLFKADWFPVFERSKADRDPFTVQFDRGELFQKMCIQLVFRCADFVTRLDDDNPSGNVLRGEDPVFRNPEPG